MARWMVTHHGASEEFLRQHVSATTDDCIEWPYCKNGKGYGLAVIDGKQRGAHNWMCRLVYGEPFSIWRFAAHRCGNPGCINPRHLRWATPKENAADRRGHGTENIGENSGKTTLTEADVLAIRAAPKWLKPLMEKYGLSRHGISKIRSGKRWAHVGGPRTSKERNSSPICRNGHPYNEANTHWTTDGYRICRVCDRDNARRRRSERKQSEQGIRWTDEEQVA